VQSDGSVLVVEDDADIRDSVVEILIEEGYVARGFANGAEALTYLRAGGVPSIILLDVTMPVMDGFEFRREVEKDPALDAIPIVLLTAGTDAKGTARDLRVADGLGKPLRASDLLHAVQRYRRTANP